MPNVRRRIARVIAGLVAGLPLLAAGAPAVAAPPPAASATVASDPGPRASPLRRFAPAVWLAKGESFRPMSAHRFIKASRLRWSHDSGCFDDTVDATPSAGRMSGRHGRVYRHRGKSTWYHGCNHGGRFYKSTEWTPPRRGSVADENEGFFLDLPDGRHHGGGIGSPAYVQRVGGHGRTLLYWFAYGWNQATLGANHEGDWERIAVRRGSDGQPHKVTFWRHKGPCYLPWRRIQRYRGHPIVFSAKGTHASYARAGKHKVVLDNLPDWTDHTSRGKQWKTWQHLKRVKRQTWWGYGGAWGETGEIGATSGPGGPSPARPNPWSGIFTDERC